MTHRRDLLAGALLGTALGDALGLPAEGMSPRAIARRFGTVDRFHLLGSIGFVSDDTEQTALVAQALVESPVDLGRAIAFFRRGLLGWFTRMPWGIGRATIRACVRIALGMTRSGVMSAGNGAAMRSGIIGVFWHDRPDVRREWARAFAEVTHLDPRAVAGSLFVAEVAALAASGPQLLDRFAAVTEARFQVTEPAVGRAVDGAMELARAGASASEAAAVCSTSGFVVSTVSLASFLYLRWGDDPLRAWAEGIALGGDTDTVAAIVGGWMGANLGESGLPGRLIDQIHDGPFGPTHLRALATALALAADGVGRRPPRYSRITALLRNLILLPVIIGHGLRRLVPL